MFKKENAIRTLKHNSRRQKSEILKYRSIEENKKGNTLFEYHENWYCKHELEKN